MFAKSEKVPECDILSLISFMKRTSNIHRAQFRDVSKFQDFQLTDVREVGL